MKTLLILLSVLITSLTTISVTNVFAENWGFGLGGDSTCNNTAQANFNNLKNYVPDIRLLVTNGDYAVDTSDQTCFYNMVKDGFDKVTIVQGNHESSSSWTQLVNFFKPVLNPELALNGDYYAFQYRNAYFIALNTEKSTAKGSEQFNFLQNKLVEAQNLKNTGQIDYVFMYSHKMFVNCGISQSLSSSDCGDHQISEISGYKDVILLLYQYSSLVDVAFFGHDHTTEISNNLGYSNGQLTILPNNDKNGIIFMVVGSYGRPLDSLPSVSQKPLWQYLDGNNYQSVILELDDNGDHIKAKTIKSNGQVLLDKDILKVSEEPLIEICGDGIDNDKDGQIDENCKEICGDGIDNNNNGQIDEDCIEICGDNIDNNGNGLIDENCVEICGDGIDNNNNGQIDENCPINDKEICDDGIDNDQDWLIDENCGVIPPPKDKLVKNVIIEYTNNTKIMPQQKLETNSLNLYPQVENSTITIIKNMTK